MKYRTEIDGLRAIAVTAVVIFHFFPKFFPHGYLGVDLFFVISGFLISLYILETTEKKSFSLLTFYQRRIKRILPATIAILIATLICAFFILIGIDFKSFLRACLKRYNYGD